MKLKHLTVIENEYQVVNWRIEPPKGYESLYSDIRPFEGMNELKDYRECGVYGTAGVPYETVQVDPHRFPEEKPYLAFAREYAALVREKAAAGEGILCTGSYCTHVPSVLGGFRQALGDKRIGVVWMDAHADNQIIETTSDKSLRLLGVPMSTFLGQTFPQWRKAVGLEPPIDGRDVLASDIRMTDEESEEALAEAQVRVLRQKDFRDAALWKKEVESLAARVDGIFLHVDADILDHSYLPAYEYDVVGGNPMEIVRENIAAVAATGKMMGATVMCIGFEGSPDRVRDVNNLTGIRLVSSVLRNWKEVPGLF